MEKKNRRKRKARKGSYPGSRWIKLAIVVTGLLAFVFGYRLIAGLCDQAVAVFGSGDGINLSKEMKDGGIPRLYQSDRRWADKSYGISKMETSGCGPTCLSMVCCGLTGETNWNPYEVAKMAERNGYYVPGTGTSWKLMTEGAEKLGLQVKEVIFDEEHIRAELAAGHPIICAVGPGDFTTEGHFIVLTGMDDQGKIIVNDPNSKKNSGKNWELERIMSQIKNLWSYEEK